MNLKCTYPYLVLFKWFLNFHQRLHEIKLAFHIFPNKKKDFIYLFLKYS